MYSNNKPYAIPVKASQTSYICRCGKTGNAPFCDGSHAAVEGVTPLAYTPEADGTAYVCGCGKSANNPMCDGAHLG